MSRIALRAELRRQLKRVNADYAVAASKGIELVEDGLITRMDELNTEIARLTDEIAAERRQPVRRKRS